MNNLRKLRDDRGLSQKELAKKVHAAQNTISNWENETRDMKTKTLCDLADVFSVSTDYLLGRKPPTEQECLTKIPVMGTVQAGTPLEAIENKLGEVSINKDEYPDGKYFALTIRGDSMEPRMSDGDTVIVWQKEDVPNGAIAVVKVNGHEATVKRVFKKENGIMLQPTNPCHEPLFFTHEQAAKKQVAIWGQVVELRANFLGRRF